MVIGMDTFVTKGQKKLRCGITTGSCATAAASAAATRLLLNVPNSDITIYTPKGIDVIIPVEELSYSENEVSYSVIKDSGDDPDVTNHTRINATVTIISPEEFEVMDMKKCFIDDAYPRIALFGGEGVGVVTKEGLEQALGKPAINKVPRSMIIKAVYDVANLALFDGFLKIMISAPEGRALAKKTFNERLGIEDGISILGTSGVIEPMSEKAIVDTIEALIKQAIAVGNKCLLVMPGNYGEEYASKYLGLSLLGSIKCSNYIGETIDMAIAHGAKEMLLVGNIGKLGKLAAGVMNTHSKVADARAEVFAVHSMLCGGDRELLESVMECINTDEMIALVEKAGIKDQVIDSICERIDYHIANRTKGLLKVGVVLFSERYGYLGETAKVAELLENFKRNPKM